MKKILLIVTLFLTGIFALYAETSDSNLLKRIEALEQKNKQLEMEIDRTKRDIADGTSDTKSLIFPKDQWGNEFGMETIGGILGRFSQVGFGLIFPKIKLKHSYMIFGLRFMMDLAFVPTLNLINNGTKTTLQQTIPMIMAGSFWMSVGSPFLFNFFRAYGVVEFSFGSEIDLINSVTVYTPNIIMNFTGFGGVEFYTSRWSAFFIEMGGGSIIAIYFQNTGNASQVTITGGFNIRLGFRVFFAKLRNRKKRR